MHILILSTITTSLPELKAYVLFTFYISGIELQYKICISTEKRLFGNLITVMKPETIPGCVRLHVCRAAERLCSHGGAQEEPSFTLHQLLATRGSSVLSNTEVKSNHFTRVFFSSFHPARDMQVVFVQGALLVRLR